MPPFFERFFMKKGIFLAILAAALYAANSPLSKLLLGKVPPTLMAGLLYLGAGAGMTLIFLLRKAGRAPSREEKLSRNDLPYVLGMIALDIAAPICLLMGLERTTAENASLLNNFEIVATALIALGLFREKISPRLWAGIGCVTLSCILLSVENPEKLEFSYGALFVLLACLFWGLENNCTRRLSEKDPMVIVILKGIFSGLGSLVIGLFLGEKLSGLLSVLAVMAVGFVSYGLSIFFYVHAQRRLGAARTSAYYAVAPFIGAILSLLIFRTLPKPVFFAALGIMGIGAFLCAEDKPLRKKK